MDDADDAGDVHIPGNPDAFPGESCARCGDALLRRRNTSTGELFMGCASFPRCKQTVPYSQLQHAWYDHLRQAAQCDASAGVAQCIRKLVSTVLYLADNELDRARIISSASEALLQYGRATPNAGASVVRRVQRSTDPLNMVLRLNNALQKDNE